VIDGVGYGTKADKLRGKLISLLEFVFVGFAHFHRIKLQPQFLVLVNWLSFHCCAVVASRESHSTAMRERFITILLVAPIVFQPTRIQRW
jgi:hypothetical protein